MRCARSVAILLAITPSLGCADFFGGRGDYGSTVGSAESWAAVLDEAGPRDEFAIRLDAVASRRTTLNWSEIAIVAGWTASQDAAVDIDISLAGESLGSFALMNSAERYSDAGVVELERFAPLALDLCVELSLRDASAMEIEVNWVEYRYDIREGSDVDVEVAIVPGQCE
jgi:hypothetical protein